MMWRVDKADDLLLKRTKEDYLYLVIDIMYYLLPHIVIAVLLLLLCSNKKKEFNSTNESNQ